MNIDDMLLFEVIKGQHWTISEPVLGFYLINISYQMFSLKCYPPKRQTPLLCNSLSEEIFLKICIRYDNG